MIIQIKLLRVLQVTKITKYLVIKGNNMLGGMKPGPRILSVHIYDITCINIYVYMSVYVYNILDPDNIPLN